MACTGVQAGREKTVMVTHMDTPGNDWNELFRQVREHPSTYARAGGRVLKYAYSGTFYEQCFPPASLSLAYSSIALHWASRCPVKRVPDALVPRRSADPAVVRAAEEVAAEDWRTFLRGRACELRPGGLFVAVTHGMEAQGLLPQDKWLPNIVYRAWRSMAEDGLITEEELYNAVQALHLRTMPDLLEPLQEEEFRGVFQVVSRRTVRIPCLIFQDYRRDKDARRLATRYADLRRAVDECMFREALRARAKEERASLVHQVFERVSVGVAQSGEIQEYTHPIHVISFRRLP